MLRGVVFSKWCVLLLHNMSEDTTTGERNGKVEVAQAAIQTDYRQQLPLNAHYICPQSLSTSLRMSQITARIAVSAL